MTQEDEDKIRLMVVDDETDNLDLLYRTFRRDFRVFKAESALKALQVLEEEEEMGIIISDQRMPKMNGTEFLSIAAERFPDTIRILLTGYTDVEDLVGAINTGKVFKYITKPWNPDELRSVTQQAAETYRILKQRTNELHRALRRESLFNAVTTAIRESLDYRSMLQTIVETLSKTFAADSGILRPIERNGCFEGSQYYNSGEVYGFPSDQIDQISLATFSGEELEAIAQNPAIHQNSISLQERPCQYLIVPLAYQHDLLAVIQLYRQKAIAPWSQEDLELLEEVAQQAALAISQARLYQRIQQQTEQMRAELAVARQIQSNLLRQSLPKLDTVRVQACCHPAREVGGDFFEVYVHPQGDLWIAVGDVSGKGVPAALFMASAISVLRRELAQEMPPEPDVLMRNLNEILSEDLVGSNCFITMVLARYHSKTKQLTYANAGHIYPMIWSHNLLLAQGSEPTEAVSLEPKYLKVRGVPLGILPCWTASAGTIALQPGEVLLLTSDGITEATMMMQEPSNGATYDATMLRQTGLWEILKQQTGSLDLNQVLAYIQAHTQIQEDDQTILALEVL